MFFDLSLNLGNSYYRTIYYGKIILEYLLDIYKNGCSEDILFGEFGVLKKVMIPFAEEQEEAILFEKAYALLKEH